MKKVMAGLVAMATVGASCLGIAFAAPAAASTSHHINGTGGDGLWMHSVASLTDGLLGILPEGAEVQVSCFVQADSVFGNDVWLYVDSQQGAGFVSDFYVDTSWSTTDDLVAQGMPDCDAETATAPVTGEQLQGGGPDQLPSDASISVPQAPQGTDWIGECGGNAYSSEIKVTDFTNGGFKISATPTSNARWAVWNGNPRETTNEIWHAVQACVSGLYDDLADSIYQQIDCHVFIAGGGGTVFPLGGETWDFESWRGSRTGLAKVAAYSDAGNGGQHMCNWNSGADSGYQPIGKPYRPDRMANNPTY